MSIRILVVEDTAKHLADAQQYFQKLVGVVVDTASTLQAAMQLIETNKYDAVISDVFFPAEDGTPATTFENAITLSKKLAELNIWHVFNTAGNHHGAQYKKFIWKTPRGMDPECPEKGAGNDIRSSGCIIESYQSDADTDSKQWEAAFRQTLLVVELLRMPDKGNLIISECGEGMDGHPYGDYGALTKTFQKITHPVVIGIWQKYNA